jgi:hypothetical protein
MKVFPRVSNFCEFIPRENIENNTFAKITTYPADANKYEKFANNFSKFKILLFFFTTQYTKTIYECLNIYKTHICIYFTMHLQLVYCRIFIKVVVWPFVDEIACADPQSCEEFCDNKAGCSNFAYPLLVIRLLPEGIITIELNCWLCNDERTL